MSSWKQDGIRETRTGQFVAIVTSANKTQDSPALARRPAKICGNIFFPSDGHRLIPHQLYWLYWPAQFFVLGTSLVVDKFSSIYFRYVTCPSRCYLPESL